ncbi:CLUMA_CG016168, isoform A [Clunio marinus]|uniref:Chromatin-remodeling ATPase INO80 n=1 Tax=Clunio marinus TaxID=568069 RepID=A0A1J1IXF8_9DIPT|nr:CLUMA_CG016168, isoform A [Clunio marinus]
MAKPLHIQRLEKALELGPFMKYAESILTKNDDFENSSDDDSGVRRHTLNQDKELMYHTENISEDRKWLYNLLLSDTESDSEISDQDKYIGEMLKEHVREKRYRLKYHQNPSNAQYGYYSAGLLSNVDMYPEQQQSVTGIKRRRKKFERKPLKLEKKHTLMSRVDKDDSNLSNDLNDIDWEDQITMSIKEEDPDSRPQSPSSRGRKRKSLFKTPELMNHRRRKMWQTMAKKEVGKYQRIKANNHKELLNFTKKTASLCQKVARQKAMESQKRQKETIWRAKRLTREMLSYWKKYDRIERENRRRLEKEAEEQRKMDVELVEVKRQQRKLNFLITQTELYAHFMSHKGELSSQEEQRILNQLDEEPSPRLSSIDNYDSELMKSKAQKNVQDAFYIERNRTKEFDKIAQQPALFPVIDQASGSIVELPQPAMFKGVLKGYQLKGMTWLAHLYDQGISGILADEMGLGKTVQSIAFLCHVAENYGVWGPFLIISPASTLHNWQQEMQRFVPNFKVVPYWGSPNQRKILRQFWDQKDLHTKDASFHVVITSYQLVVSDYKYFNRIKWQYMVLDEAQAIKSTSSVRWKLLLGFNCRNRLLLSGTPIQNSMAELWALLHFIMPTLFDSHDEFNEWFSKDIESHAENKTGIDEKQISRLHMILKPFMLRRIKKDVENELSDKIEIMTYCPLTTRQKFLYMALKKKIRIEDLLKATGQSDGHTTDKNFTSNLMNLVMQFRKVCNHPELFERRDIRSPFALSKLEYQMPRLVYNELRLHKMIPSKKHLLYNKFNIFKAENVHRRMRPEVLEVDGFSFLRFVNLSSGEVEKLTLCGLLEFLLHAKQSEIHYQLLNYRNEWWKDVDKRFLLLTPSINKIIDKRFMMTNSILRNFIFTSNNSRESSIYTHQNQLMCSMQETTDHRIIRSRHAPANALDEHIKTTPVKSPTIRGLKSPMKSPTIRIEPIEKKLDESCGHIKLLPEYPHIPQKPRKIICEATEMPKFLYKLPPKIQSTAKRLYVESREAAWEFKRFDHCDCLEGWQLINNSIKQMHPHSGWSTVTIPDKQALVSDAGKLFVLDLLLTRLKSEGHRVLIYSQMTKMIDLLEEYMWHRKHRYMRLDGSSKISARRDMVADFQSREDIFCFLLSTRAGGLGINLTAADTVIFYDSDWNPTVDQQAMDRAHRLGQTKQVTVYRLICKGTIEERILQRAREKSEIQRMVISGGNFKPDTLKPKEVVSLLLDDEEIETKYRQKKGEEKKPSEERSWGRPEKESSGRKRKNFPLAKETKKQKLDLLLDAEDLAFLESGGAPSPSVSEQSHGSKLAGGSAGVNNDDDSSIEGLVVDHESAIGSIYGDLKPPKKRNPQRAGNRRPGRPRGTGKKRDDMKPIQPQGPKRGPGRPKTKQTGGPSNQGYRNVPLQRVTMVKSSESSRSFDDNI